jgi:hypothetical protein
MTDRSSNLKDALAYAAERGWPVFPVPPNTKASHKAAKDYGGRKWGNTRDPDEIARDFTRWPHAGIGLMCGAASGVFVLDVDAPEAHGVDGFASLAALEAEHGKLPPTLMAETPSSGRHYFFAWPTDGIDVKSRSGKVGAGLDVKATNGIVLLPPTRKGDGCYRWLNDLPIAPAPEWLLALARKDNHRGNAGDRPPIEFPDGEPDAEVDLEKLAFAMAALPNMTLDEVGGDTADPRYFDYDDWLAVLMACHRSFGGSPEGFRIFNAWSEKWSEKNPDKHDVAAKTWAGFGDDNPVREITARTVYHFAELAVPGWDAPYHAEAERRLEAANRDPELHAMTMASLAASPSTNTPEAAKPATISADSTNAKPDAGTSPSAEAAKPAKAAPKAKAKPNKAAKPSSRPMTALPLTLAEVAGGGYVKEQVVDDVNKRHAFVLVGSKGAIMLFEDDGKTFRLIGIDAFRNWYLNKAVPLGEDEPVSPASLWLTDRTRREYEGIEFKPAPAKVRPGYYNLWQGFAVEPRPGDCSKFLGHVRDNVAQGDPSLHNWVIGFFAQLVQQPDKKIGVALALRGKPGVGKTKVGDVIGSLFPDHYAIVSDARYVTGQFNAHMKSLLLLHADEAFWAGDKRGEGRLKDLITGHVHYLEFKGVDPIPVRNYIRLFATGNADWVVPVALRERRWGVLDVGASHIQDHAYFAAIDEEMDHGGREALLHYLLNFDLKTVDLYDIPQTAALLEQKFASATPGEKFWLDTLKSGRLPGALEAAPNTCLKDKLYERYYRHASRTGQSHRSIETKVGMFLSKYVGAGLVADEKVKYVVYTPRGDKITKRGPAFRFPPLADCRRAFAAEINQDVDWGADADDWQADEVVEVEPRTELTYDAPGERGSS